MDIQTVHPYNQDMKLLSRILPLNNILLNLPATSKKRAFEQAGLLFENNNGLERAAVFESLFARERLGSTGLGSGVAVPHGRVKGINHSVAAFLRLDQPIPFDSPDGKPVMRYVLSPELRSTILLKILEFRMPKLRGMEVNGKLDVQTQVVIVRFGDQAMTPVKVIDV